MGRKLVNYIHCNNFLEMHSFFFLWDLDTLLFLLISSFFFLYSLILLFTCKWATLVTNVSHLLYILESQLCFLSLRFHSASKYLVFHAFYFSPFLTYYHHRNFDKVSFWIGFVCPLEIKTIHISLLFSSFVTQSCWSWWLYSLKISFLFPWWNPPQSSEL